MSICKGLTLNRHLVLKRRQPVGLEGQPFHVKCLLGDNILLSDAHLTIRLDKVSFSGFSDEKKSL